MKAFKISRCPVGERVGEERNVYTIREHRKFSKVDDQVV